MSTDPFTSVTTPRAPMPGAVIKPVCLKWVCWWCGVPSGSRRPMCGFARLGGMSGARCGDWSGG